MGSVESSCLSVLVSTQATAQHTSVEEKGPFEQSTKLIHVSGLMVYLNSCEFIF